MKNYKLLIICPLVALLCISCGSDMAGDLPDVSQKGTTVIKADIESILLEGDTRVWPEGAYVGVFGSESGINEKYVLKRSDAGLSNAEFYGPEVSGETISAYFPWSDTFTGRAGAMPAQLSAAQDYADTTALEIFRTYCPTAYSSMNGGRMKFLYPFGMLRVRIELFDCLKVQRISFTSSGAPAAGKGVILSDGTLKMEGGGVSSVVLDCGEGVDSIREDGGFSDFYLTLIPGNYTDAVLVIHAAGEDPIVCTLRNIAVPRIDASDYKLASVTVSSGDPQGFIVNEQQFD